MRAEMVDTQLAGRGIRHPAVLEAMRRIPRHLFVPEGDRAAAYADGPLPIGLGQTISQPYMVGFMTEELDPGPGDKVLEIGTGSGYQTAVLAELAGHVYTVERLEALSEKAQAVLAELGYRNISYRLGDGSTGWTESGPYRRILVTAAAEAIPESLIEQLEEGGRIVIPVGRPADTQRLMVGEKVRGILQMRETFAVRFVPLIHGTKPGSKQGRS